MNELITESNNGVMTLVLNRPEKRNALNDALVDALKVAFRSAGEDEGLRAVVLKGAGKDFCSGADLAALRKIAEGGILENLADAESLMELFLIMRKLPLPIVASVHGRALAGGCGLATACDIVLAADSAVFGYPEVKIGFVPAMVMAMLRRSVSEKRAFELVTRGFQFSAAEAERFGLINKVVPDSDLDSETVGFASGYNEVSRSAVMLSKKLLYQIDGMTFEDALSLGSELNAIARLTDDCKSGISRFLDGKK